MLTERHSSVVGHSKCGGVVGGWDQFTVQRDKRLSCIFVVMSVSVDFVVET